MSYADPQAHTMAVLDQVLEERARQDEEWGPPDPACPDGTGSTAQRAKAALAKEETDRRAEDGRLTFRHILEEEVAEALAEEDQGRLRAELIQVAAVAVKWIEAIDRRYQP